MKSWIKVMAIALPVTLVGGYWIVSGGEPQRDSTEESTLPPLTSSEGLQSPPEPTQAAKLQGQVARETPQPAVEIALPAKPQTILPALLDLPSSLNSSDESAVSVLSELSPSLVQWLVPQEQVRKWVLAIDLLADGRLPQRHRPLAFSAPAFQVAELTGEGETTEVGSERYRAALRNQQRFNDLVEAVTLIDPRTAGRYYKAWLPMLEQAYAELGKQGDFNQRLFKAVDNILATKAMSGDGVLKQPHVLYEFESSAVEQSSALEKALWRLGDENRVGLQAFLKELRFYL
ncbi:MAG: DUF3014 domain-containing protein [Cellvibrionaceae bacterium]